MTDKVYIQLDELQAKFVIEALTDEWEGTSKSNYVNGICVKVRNALNNYYARKQKINDLHLAPSPRS